MNLSCTIALLLRTEKTIQLSEPESEHISSEKVQGLRGISVAAGCWRGKSSVIGRKAANGTMDSIDLLGFFATQK